MNSDQLAEIVDAHRDDRESTHWDGCHLAHPGCAVQVLADEVESLNERVATLARALVVAAQHERGRLATADHQRALADRWLDLARSALPPLPTVEEAAGLYASHSLARDHQKHDRQCDCLGYSAVCCRPGCPCLDQEGNHE